MGGAIGGMLAGIFGSSGPSQQMQNTAAKQSSLADSLMSSFNDRYKGQSDILGQLRSAYSPIIAGGINQQGFSSPVLAAMNTAAMNNSAAASSNARMAGANALAGQNSSSGLKSGVQQQIEGSINAQETGQLAQTQNAITQANYATGRSNYLNALQGEAGVAKMEDPTAFSSQAGQNLDASFSQQKTISDEKNAQSAALWGGIGSLVGDAATFGMGGIAGMAPGVSPSGAQGIDNGSGFGNFFKGGIDALSGQG